MHTTQQEGAVDLTIIDFDTKIDHFSKKLIPTIQNFQKMFWPIENSSLDLWTITDFINSPRNVRIFLTKL